MTLQPEAFRVLGSPGLFLHQNCHMVILKYQNMPSFRIHSFTLILQNSIFKEILGRVLTHSGFYRKESSFLPFFKLTFTDKIKPEKAQLAVGPDKVIIVEVSSTCIAQGQLQLGGWGGHRCMLSVVPVPQMMRALCILCCVVLAAIRKEILKQPRMTSFPRKVKRITSTLKN